MNICCIFILFCWFCQISKHFSMKHFFLPKNFIRLSIYWKIENFSSDNFYFSFISMKNFIFFGWKSQFYLFIYLFIYLFRSIKPYLLLKANKKSIKQRWKYGKEGKINYKNLKASKYKWYYLLIERLSVIVISNESNTIISSTYF